MEPLDEQDRKAHSGPPFGWREVGIVAAAAVVGSSTVVASGASGILWADTTIHFAAFAVALAASVRNERLFGFLCTLSSPAVMLSGFLAYLSAYDLDSCFTSGRCGEGNESVVVVAYLAGSWLLAAGLLLASRPRLVPVDPGSMGEGQTGMERYQTDLLARRRQGEITEMGYQTGLLEVRHLARQKAEGAITDDEYEAAAAKLLDSETDSGSERE